MTAQYKSASPYAFETLTVTAAAVPLTPSVYNLSAIGPKVVILTVESNPIRYRVDGTDPTAAVGHLVPVGSQIEIVGIDSIRKLRMIRSAAADASVSVTYYQG